MISESFGKLGQVVFTLIICVLSLFAIAPTRAQVSKQEAQKIRTPSEEIFTDSTDLMIPWRDSRRGCDGVQSRYKLPGCPTDVRWPENDRRVMMSLYDEDGSLWYRFDIRVSDDGVPPQILRDDFKPLAPKNVDHFRTTVILRLAGESPNWYKVEVNDDTRETKYILKSDNNWAKIPWSFVFNWSQRVVTEARFIKLRDKPGGEVIKEYSELSFSRLYFEKLDGDWMYVRAEYDLYPGKGYYGWTRWRNGRQILVGSYLNDFEIPEISP